MKSKFVILCGVSAVLFTALAIVRAADTDPGGILRKPIPDKLVVLTFDDACASGYTVVAPILKPLGFNGTFYVCDFDSFRTRKDWYMTWRQMIELDRQGFEIGNHTVGHSGGMDNFLAMGWPGTFARISPSTAIPSGGVGMSVRTGRRWTILLMCRRLRSRTASRSRSS